MATKTQQNILRFLMWNMKWMTRHIGFVARPFARFYASQEVLACGIRDDSGVHIIFIEKFGEREFTFSKMSTTWSLFDGDYEQDYAPDLVREIRLDGGLLGEYYRVCGEKKSGKAICSPSITIKAETVDISDSLSVRRQGEELIFEWPSADRFDSMVYFLTIEGNAETFAAIYTKETTWTYSNFRSAPLSLGPPNVKPIDDEQEYVVKLILIDYDGWVSHKAEGRFKDGELFRQG